MEPHRVLVLNRNADQGTGLEIRICADCIGEAWRVLQKALPQPPPPKPDLPQDKLGQIRERAEVYRASITEGWEFDGRHVDPRYPVPWRMIQLRPFGARNFIVDGKGLVVLEVLGVGHMGDALAQAPVDILALLQLLDAD